MVSIHGNLFFVLVIFDAMNLSFATVNLDLKPSF